MNYQPILDKLSYWKSYDGNGDEYRKTHDLDCILAGGDLNADTIISLWLPLRYTLNYFERPEWTCWKDFEAKYLKTNGLTLKNHNEFLEDLGRNIQMFLPEHELTYKLIRLFELGQKRCNVMLLLDRSWNSMRGGYPYWDYLPHFLCYYLLDGKDPVYSRDEIISWIKSEHLEMFFEKGIIEKEYIIDLAGTGCVCSHSPQKIVLPILLQNYISMLEKREYYMLSVEEDV